MGLLSGQTLTQVCLQVIAILLITQIVRLIQRWYRLRHIPGPKGAAWSTWWQLRGALSGRYHERPKNAADQFGMKALLFSLVCRTSSLTI